MSEKKGIIPFDPGYGRKKGGLVRVGDLEAVRRAFERPVREATVSEVVNYYAQAERKFAASPSSTQIIPAILAKLPALVGHYNTLEAARERMGWLKKREETEGAIARALSWKEGLERLRAASEKFDLLALVRRHFGNNAEWTDDDALLTACNLTAEEVMWISVLQEIPSTLFNDNLLETCTIVDHFYDGLEWSLDTLRKHVGSSPRDTYEVLGLTGVRDDAEFTRFVTAFKALLVAYYHMVIGDADLFDRVWTEAGIAAIQSGDGKLLRAFAAKEGRTVDDGYATSARAKINDWLASLRIVHVARTAILQPKDVIKLVGLLEAVPGCLMEGGQFGFVPCGKGAMFLGADLREVEYAPMDPYVAHLAQIEIQHSAGSVDRANRIWHFLFGRIRGHIEKKNIEEGNFTHLDEIGADIYLKYGIKIDLGVKKTLQGPKMSGEVDGRWFGAPEATHSFKIGYFTLTLIARVLEKIPASLLHAVKTVKRDDFQFSLEMLNTGQTRWGEFNEEDGTLTVFHPHVKEMDTVKEAQFEHCVAHELGHGVYLADPRIAKTWARLSDARGDFPIPKRREHFLSAYASTSIKEDFSETLASFLIFGKEFREQIVQWPILAEKYAFMKALLGKEFEQETVVTLEEISGPLTFDFTLQAKINEEMGDDIMKAALKKYLLKDEKAERRALPGPQVESVERKDEEALELPYVVESEPIIRRVLRARLGKKARFVDPEEIEYHVVQSGRRDIAGVYLLNRIACTLEEAEAHIQAVVEGLKAYSNHMRAVNDLLGDETVDPMDDDED